MDASLITHSHRPHSLAVRAPFVLHATAFEVVIELRASSQLLLDQLCSHLPHSAELLPAPASPARTYTLLDPTSQHGLRLYADNRKLAEHVKTQPLMELFAREAIIHVANHAPGFVFVHAGVVAWQGRAILLPGRSFAGKTTLVASLVRAGAVYYSDEYALLDPAGLVHPYARNLQMRQPGGTRQTSLPVQELHGVAGTAPIPVASVYFTRYRSEAIWRPRPVPTGQAALRMLPHAIPIRRSPARVLETLAVTMSHATAWASPRADADIAATAILAQP